VVFEYPGGAFAALLDSIAKRNKIKLVVPRNDQAASLMADGYARASGKIGVCMATSGPGATNLITGVANAYMDSIPLLVLTGQVSTNQLKKNFPTRQMGFQEIDIINIAKGFTKAAFLVEQVSDIPYFFDKALKIATTGRKGPVWIDLPMDVQFEEIDSDKFKKAESYEEFSKSYIDKKKLSIIVEKLKKSLSPVIIAGGGVLSAKASSKLTYFARMMNIPVATTLMGKGAYPEDDTLSLGMMGCHGARYTNIAVQKADLILALGTRFDIRAIGTEADKFAPDAFIIHVDIDLGEINKRVKTDISIVANVADFLEALIYEMTKVKYDPNRKMQWLIDIARWKENLNYRYRENGKLKPQYIVKEIDRLVDKGNTIITTDVGSNQMWVAQFYHCKIPYTFLTSGGMGTMGFGLPAAIGAYYAKPNFHIINITGDGSFQMNIQELATVKQYHLPIKIFVLTNGTLGLVRQFQEVKFGGRYTSTILEFNPDFSTIAKAYNIKGIKVTRRNEVKEAIKFALNIDEPIVVDFKIDPMEKVLPILMGKKRLDEQTDYSDSYVPRKEIRENLERKLHELSITK